MKICTSCQNEQQEGKFCGKCGHPLTDGGAAPTEQAATTENVSNQQQMASNQNTQQPNEQIELLKTESKAYIGYFLEKLKMPSSASDFKNSLISIVIFLVLSAIGIFTYANNMTGGYIQLPFFGIFTSLVIFFALMILVSVLSIFITTSLSEDKPPFKLILEKYGNLFSLTIALSIIGLLLILLKSNNAGILLISLALTIVVSVIPMYVATKYVQNLTFKLDKFYVFLMFLVIQIILYTILFVVLADNLLGQIQNYIPFF